VPLTPPTDSLLLWHLDQNSQVQVLTVFGSRRVHAFQHDDGRNQLDELAKDLPAGGAIAAVLIEHRWAEALNAAVGEMGGRDLLGEFVDATELSALVPRIASAAQG